MLRASQESLPLETQLRSEVVVDAAELDQVLTAKLLVEASEGVTAIAIELASLYDGWVAQRVAPESIAWLRSVLERLGFWAGRLDCAADPELVAMFPRLD